MRIGDWSSDVCSSDLGYRLLRAKGGEEALAAVAAERPDLILLDVMMPRVDGLEVCRRLTADARTRFIPVVMVTSPRDEIGRASCRERGCQYVEISVVAVSVNKKTPFAPITKTQ